MGDDQSVTQWIRSLKGGSQVAAQKIWERYYDRMVRIAHAKLHGRPRRGADKEDVAQEAFASFFCAVKDGRFPRLDDRDDLWQVLLLLTDRRATDLQRRELAIRRGGGRVTGESGIYRKASPGSEALGQSRLDDFEGREPSPETVDDLMEFITTRWSVFSDERLGQIGLDKLQGYSNQEIAERHGISVRSVERKLGLIRSSLVHETTKQIDGSKKANE